MQRCLQQESLERGSLLCSPFPRGPQAHAASSSSAPIFGSCSHSPDGWIGPRQSSMSR